MVIRNKTSDPPKNLLENLGPAYEMHRLVYMTNSLH